MLFPVFCREKRRERKLITGKFPSCSESEVVFVECCQHVFPLLGAWALVCFSHKAAESCGFRMGLPEGLEGTEGK